MTKRILVLLMVLAAGISVAYIITSSEEGDVSTGEDAPVPSLDDYCSDEQVGISGERTLPAIISPLFVGLMERNGGQITGEGFCIISQNGGYTAVLDFREDANPVQQLRGWFEENFGMFGYDVCELMMQLNVITLRDGGGHPAILCNGKPDQEDPEEKGGSGIVRRLSRLLDRRHFLFQI